LAVKKKIQINKQSGLIKFFMVQKRGGAWEGGLRGEDRVTKLDKCLGEKEERKRRAEY